MKLFLLIFLLLAPQVPPSGSSAEQGSVPLNLEPLDLSQVLSASELEQYNRKTSYKDRMDLFRKVMERFSKQITSSVKQRKIEDSLHILRQMRSLAEVGNNQTENIENPKDLRSKQVKKLEIRLRKLGEILQDLQNAVPFDYREHFESGIKALEEFRNQLLTHLFGESISSNGTDRALTPRNSFSRPAPPLEQRRGGGVRGDQFTDAEYEKIQLAQELVKRVEVFLEIAESRLDELQRRKKQMEWEKDEPNPLEFYLPEQLIHAYDRSIDGIMVNIDEKAKYKTATEKDIRKSLKKLNEQIVEFIPQLEDFKKWSIEIQDEEFYREILKAQKNSDVAQKGSQMALGAPVK